MTRTARVSQAFSSRGHANLVRVFQRLAGKSPLLPPGIESFDLLTLPFTRRFKSSIAAAKVFLHASVIL